MHVVHKACVTVINARGACIMRHVHTAPIKPYRPLFDLFLLRIHPSASEAATLAKGCVAVKEPIWRDSVRSVFMARVDRFFKALLAVGFFCQDVRASLVSRHPWHAQESDASSVLATLPFAKPPPPPRPLTTSPEVAPTMAHDLEYKLLNSLWNRKIFKEK